MKINEEKVLLLQKDKQDQSIFRLIPEEHWQEIGFEKTSVLLKKLKKVKDKYLYMVSIPIAPRMYIEAGTIEIPIEKDEEFLSIFSIVSEEEINKIEDILFFKALKGILGNSNSEIK